MGVSLAGVRNRSKQNEHGRVGGEVGMVHRDGIAQCLAGHGEESGCHFK